MTDHVSLLHPSSQFTFNYIALYLIQIDLEQEYNTKAALKNQ